MGPPALYASTWEVRLDDGGVIFTRDPGDALWACTFDDLMTQWRISTPSLLPSTLSADRKGDCLELTLAAAMFLLDVAPGGGGAGPGLQRCLCAARILIEDLARTNEEMHFMLHPAHEVLVPKPHGVEITRQECPKCHRAVSGRWPEDSGSIVYG